MREFVKHFCRLITDQELDHDSVIKFFDIVQSEVPVENIYGHDEDDKYNVDVVEYSDSKGGYVYEIVLKDQLSLEEGERISDLLAEELPFDFEFETSLEI